MRPDLRVTLCPTLLYPQDPETRGTTKVQGGGNRKTFRLHNLFMQAVADM